MSTIDTIMRFFAENNYIKNGQTIGEKDSLIENGILDSVKMLSLIDFIEEFFGIQVDEDELIPEHFDSISAIEAYVAAKGS